MENLNPSQNEVLQQLLSLDLDKIVVEEQYKFGDEFQRVIVGMLLCDRFFTVQAEGLIKPDYFTNEVHRLVVRLLFEYWYKYKTLPSKIFLAEELTQRLKVKDSAVRLVYLGELNNIYDYYTRGGVGDLLPNLDSREAILDKITAFAKTQAIRGAFYQSFQEIKRNPESEEVWAKVDEYYRNARAVDRKIDIGLNYFETLEERYARLAEVSEKEDFFSLGFPEINNCLQGGGLKRGEIGAVLGLPGTGKSLSLVLAAIENMMKSHKVLYITTEMDQDRVGTRFDSMLTNIGQHRLMGEKDVVWAALREHVSAYEDKRRLIIKQFPSGTADVSTVRAYHAQLHMYGFDPDLLIMDYVGDMKDSPGMPTWESRFRIVRDLRGFGVEERHCTLTALQPNRGPGEMKADEFLDESRQADSFGQNRVLDLFYTINQTPTEQKAAVGRIFLAKVRNGRSRIHFKIGFDYRDQTLRIWQISNDVYKAKMSEVKEQVAETVIVSVVEQAKDAMGIGVSRKGGKWKPSDESEQ